MTAMRHAETPLAACASRATICADESAKSPNKAKPECAPNAPLIAVWYN